jgi:hypothetical protein
MSASTVTAYNCKTQGLFPDPADCTGYYICSSTRQATRETCLLYTYYDQVSQDCLQGNCSNTPVNTTTNTTTPTTTAPSINAIQSPTTSPATATNMTVTPTTPHRYNHDGIHPLTIPMYCSRINETFPDPDNCHKYYRCNDTLSLVSQTCSLGSISYYNVDKGACEVGFC